MGLSEVPPEDLSPGLSNSPDCRLRERVRGARLDGPDPKFDSGKGSLAIKYSRL